MVHPTSGLTVPRAAIVAAWGVLDDGVCPDCLDSGPCGDCSEKIGRALAALPRPARKAGSGPDLRS